jgi:hypothetical protein
MGVHGVHGDSWSPKQSPNPDFEFPIGCGFPLTHVASYLYVPIPWEFQAREGGQGRHLEKPVRMRMQFDGTEEDLTRPLCKKSYKQLWCLMHGRIFSMCEERQGEVRRKKHSYP